MSRRYRYQIPTDPNVEARIREILAIGAEDAPTLDLPKPKPSELLQRWKISAAAAQSPANRKAKVERSSPLTPRQRQDRFAAQEDR